MQIHAYGSAGRRFFVWDGPGDGQQIARRLDLYGLYANQGGSWR